MHVLLFLLALAVLAIPFRGQIRQLLASTRSAKAVNARVKQYGPAARRRLRPAFRKAGVAYPPRRLVLVGLKLEKKLQVYAGGRKGALRFICAYPILGASGSLGPKLREGDLQVPEGFYRIDWLNPNSAYHLSLHVDYPNAFDRKMGRKDGRKHLGGDIMIHGSNCSVGCLAMGDQAAEDLFVLVADTGLSRNRLIISPLDFRTKAPRTALPKKPA